MVRSKVYQVRYSQNRRLWRAEGAKGPVGRWYATFKGKSRAEAFLKAAKREFQRTKRVSFLTSPHLLIDAIESFRLLEQVPGRSKLRKAAALFLLCHEDQKREPKPYSEPESRQLELPPALFRAVSRLAREKGVDPSDLVAQLVWEHLRRESEKEVAKHTYRDEGKIPLRCLL